MKATCHCTPNLWGPRRRAIDQERFSSCNLKCSPVVSPIVLKLVEDMNHLCAEIIFFERPSHVHVHCLKVIVVVIVSVVIVVVVVIVVDVVVYVHDGVDGHEDKGKEGKGIEAGLRGTTGGRSRL